MSGLRGMVLLLMDDEEYWRELSRCPRCGRFRPQVDTIADEPVFRCKTRHATKEQIERSRAIVEEAKRAIREREAEETRRLYQLAWEQRRD